jgi:hypothetical protein
MEKGKIVFRLFVPEHQHCRMLFSHISFIAGSREKLIETLYKWLQQSVNCVTVDLDTPVAANWLCRGMFGRRIDTVRTYAYIPNVHPGKKVMLLSSPYPTS